MSCLNFECDNGWEIREHPEEKKPYALACKQCRPRLRFIQLNERDDLQEKIRQRNNKLREGDNNAK